MKKFPAIFASVAAVLAGGYAIAQVTLPYVTSMSATDAMAVIPKGAPAPGNKYATLLQLQSYFFSGNSQHGATAPALTSCGTSPAISGTDFAGLVTEGTGTPTGCVVTFNTAYTAAPYCVVVGQSDPNNTTIHYTVSTTAITITNAAADSGKYNYICVGQQGG